MRIQPRFPLGGSLHGLVSVISDPYKTAGGPVKQSPPQPGPGTQGPSTPPLPIAVGSAQAGGSTGSGKAESGKLKPGALKQEPRLPSQPRHRHGPLSNEQLPSVHGNASDVVVGSGANKQLPVESIAGSRRFVHPIEGISRIPIINMNVRNDATCDRSQAESRGSSVIAIRVIVPSVD